MKDEIRSFLLTHGADRPAELVDDESLLDAGVLDSAAMMDLIAFLEGRFKIRIDEDDMVPENFDTVTSIVRYVSGRCAA